jgi:hypothetical protein
MTQLQAAPVHQQHQRLPARAPDGDHLQGLKPCHTGQPDQPRRIRGNDTGGLRPTQVRLISPKYLVAANCILVSCI